MNFPKYDGSCDPLSWFSRCEKYFELHHVRENLKVKLASFHLEGDSQIWFDMLRETRDHISWEDLKYALNIQFGPSEYEDFYGDLTRLQQEGDVKDYTNKFNRLMTRAGGMSERQKISSYTCGLKPTLRYEVKTQKLVSLIDAQGLARHFELKSLAEKKQVGGWKYNRGTSNTGLANKVDVQAVAIGSKSSEFTKEKVLEGPKRFTPSQIQERREKGLCFKCNVKFVPGHKC